MSGYGRSSYSSRTSLDASERSYSSSQGSSRLSRDYSSSTYSRSSIDDGERTSRRYSRGLEEESTSSRYSSRIRDNDSSLEDRLSTRMRSRTSIETTEERPSSRSLRSDSIEEKYSTRSSIRDRTSIEISDEASGGGSRYSSRIRSRTSFDDTPEKSRLEEIEEKYSSSRYRTSGLDTDDSSTSRLGKKSAVEAIEEKYGLKGDKSPSRLSSTRTSSMESSSSARSTSSRKKFSVEAVEEEMLSSRYDSKRFASTRSVESTEEVSLSKASKIEEKKVSALERARSYLEEMEEDKEDKKKEELKEELKESKEQEESRSKVHEETRVTDSDQTLDQTESADSAAKNISVEEETKIEDVLESREDIKETSKQEEETKDKSSLETKATAVSSSSSIPSSLVVQELTSPSTPSVDVVDKYTIEEVEDKEITVEETKGNRGSLLIREVSEISVIEEESSTTTSRQASKEVPSRQVSKEVPASPQPTTTDPMSADREVKSPLTPLLDKMARLRQESQNRASSGEGEASDAEGRPRTPSYHWFKDGVEFDAADRFQCQFDDEEDSLALVFQRVTPEDAGLYTCTATTSNGKISCSAELTVQGDMRRLNKTPEPPEVKFEMGDVSAGAGTSAMIEARISGFPKPSMTWFHDDQEVQADARHKFLENEEDETFALIIKDVKPEDSGEYTLKAKNQLGEVSTKAKMSVTCAPKFKKQLSNKTVAAGDDFTLEIEFEGYPEPTVKWLKDGNEIKDDGKRIRIITESSSEKKSSLRTSTSKVIIEKSTTSESGSYSVVIANSCGQQSSVSAVAVKSLPKFETGMKSQDVKDGESAEFTIKVSGSPTPTVSFMKDGKAITADGDHIKITDDGNGQYRLSIDKCSPSDVGSYSCTATNEGGCQESSATLKIKSKPSFSRSLNDSEAKVGDQDVNFTVVINSSPEAQVKWLLNGKTISKENKDNFEVISDGNTHTLRIKEVSMAHSGSYTCIAENSEGKSETSAKFTVTAKAKITKKLKDISLSELGVSITLSVTVEGSPKPTVKWTKDSKEVTETERIQIKEEISEVSVSYTLIIKESSSSDLGLWECSASNCFGSDSSQSRVSHDKGSKPSFKKGLSSVSALQEEHDIQFTVQLQESEGGDTAPESKTKVRWFIDDIEIVEVDKRYEMTAEEASQTYKLMVKTADEGTAGTYKCKAINSKGEAETCGELTVSSKPEFMQGLEDREATEGESLTMDVVINGNPAPEIKWFKNGKPLVSGGGITIEKESEMVHLLTIEKVDKNTTGVYECVISNRVGEAKSSGKLDIMCKPFFVKDLNESADGVLGDEGSIEVVVGGCPRPSVVWFKNDEQITTEVVREHKDDLYRLKFEPIDKENNAKYHCEAKNKVGSTKSKTCQFSTREPKKEESKPRFTSGLTDKVVDAGSPLILKCVIDGSPKPALGDIKWFKDGNEVPIDGNRIKMDYDPESGLCTLTINNITADDLGNYRCLVSNALGKNDSNCKVTGGEGFEKPKFIRGLTDGSALHEQTDIELEVELDKKYACQKLRWFLDDIEVIEADSRFNMISESSYVFKLIIKKADEFRTVGTYKCVASNSFGNTETSCQFSVNSAPKIVEVLKDREAEPAGDISLRVRVTGSPRPQVKWFKDGKEIFADNKRIKMTTEELSSSYSLVIHDVTEADLGSYSCEAINVVGKDSSSCNVTAGAGFLKPIFKRGLKDITVNQDDKDVTLVVETGPAKEGIRNDIKWIYNDIEISPNDDRFRFINDDHLGIYKLVIKNAEKNSIGIFKCVASNQHGKNRTQGRVSMKRTTDFEVHIPERKPIEREPFNFESESHYTPGPDTMLIQHRDPDYPLRVREYLRVGAKYSPYLANKLRESHWGDADVSYSLSCAIPSFYFRNDDITGLRTTQIGYGFSPQVAVRERRRFNDVQKEIEHEVVNNEPYTRGRRFYKNSYIPNSRPTTPNFPSSTASSSTIKTNGSM